jgi:fructose-specific phosphotransferase system IIC component
LRSRKDVVVRRTTALFLLYLVIGVIVAYSDDYLENLDRIRRLLSAVLAILLWPLVLLGFDVRVT